MSATASMPMNNVVVEQTRIIKTPRGDVFRAWTESAIMQTWFGPTGMHCPRAELDVRPGGAYRIDVYANPGTVTPSGNTRSTATGVYTKIVPNELLQFTWIPSWNENQESLVTITLRDVAGGTELHLRHERISSDESCRGYTMGWAGSIEKLADMLDRRTE